MKILLYVDLKRVSILLALATLFALYLMFSRSLCCDEAATVLYAYKYDYSNILSGIPGEYNPPFFYFLAKFAHHNFGLGAVGIRYISVLSYLVSIIFFYLLMVSYSQDSRLAILASFIFSFLPINLFYSYQARAYSTMLMACTAMLYFCLQAWTNEKKYFFNLVAYTLFLIFGIYCHYFVGIWAILLFVGISVVIFVNKFEKKYCKYYLRILCANIVALVVFFPEFLRAISYLNEVTNLDFIQGTFPWGARVLFNGYGLLFGEIFKPNGWRLGVSAATIISFLLVILGVDLKLLSRKFWIALFLFLIGLFVTSYLKVSRPMYGIFLTVPISYLIAVLIYQSRGWFRSIGLAGLVICSAIILSTFVWGNSSSYFAPAYSIKYKEIYLRLSNLGNKKTALIVSPEWNRSIWKSYAKNDDFAQIIFFDAHQKGTVKFPEIDKDINSVILVMEASGQAMSLDRELRLRFANHEIMENEFYTSFLGHKNGIVYQIIKYNN